MLRTDHLAPLVVRVAAHDRAALERLYRVTAAHLFGIAVGITGDEAPAAAVLEATYLGLWRGEASAVPGEPETAAWLEDRVRRRATEMSPAPPGGARVADVADALAPPASTWLGIERQLLPAGVPAAAPAGHAARRSNGAALARFFGGALAGVFAVALLARTWPVPATAVDELPASFFGILTDRAGTPAVMASSLRHGRRLTVKLLAPLSVPPGRIAELWAVRDDGSSFPLGTLPETGSRWVDLQDEARAVLARVVTLTVTFEPAPALHGASPTAERALSGACVATS